MVGRRKFEKIRGGNKIGFDTTMMNREIFEIIQMKE